MTSRPESVESRCAECGQRAVVGACRECFEALLAYENERPQVFGAVHLLTVATYHLQHPAGYTLDALASWRMLVAESMDGHATTGTLAARMREQFDGARRVRLASGESSAHLHRWPRQWPMTVGQVLSPLEALPEEREYMTRALEWAAATRAILDAGDALDP